MKYYFNVYSLVSLKSGNTNPTIVIGYDRTKVDLLLLGIPSLNYNFTSISARSKIIVGGFEMISPNSGALTAFDAIQSGDIIVAYENDIAIYYGYILKTSFQYSQSAKLLTIEFDTLLSHFTRQNMIQSQKDVSTLSPQGQRIVNTDFFVNQIKISDLLSFMMEDSIYAEANLIANTISVKYNSPDWLNQNTQVFYYPSTQSTKEQVLLNSIMFYQVMLYQDTNGNIVFTLPSTNNKSSYNFDTSTPISNEINTSQALNVNLRAYEIIANEAELTNNVVVSLLYAGFFPGPKQLANLSIPNANYFPRSNFLYTSGYFSQVQLNVESLQSIITNPTLIELFYKLANENKAISSVKPSNTDQIDSAIGLLSQRYLAQALTYSKYIVLELERNLSTAEIPIGKTFIVNNQQWFCINATIELQTSNDGTQVSNILRLLGVPLFSITGAWETS